MSAIAATGSTDVDDVVPDRRDDRDRQAAGGAVRGDRRVERVAAGARTRSLAGIRTRAARPRPSVMHAFSIELWASAEA